MMKKQKISTKTSLYTFLIVTDKWAPHYPAKQGPVYQWHIVAFISDMCQYLDQYSFSYRKTCSYISAFRGIVSLTVDFLL